MKMLVAAGVLLAFVIYIGVVMWNQPPNDYH